RREVAAVGPAFVQTSLDVGRGVLSRQVSARSHGSECTEVRTEAWSGPADRTSYGTMPEAGGSAGRRPGGLRARRPRPPKPAHRPRPRSSDSVSGWNQPPGGTPNDGAQDQDPAPYGPGPQGPVPQGAGPHDVLVHGAGRQGTGPQGAPPQGAAPYGAGAQGP